MPCITSFLGLKKFTQALWPLVLTITNAIIVVNDATAVFIKAAIEANFIGKDIVNSVLVDRVVEGLVCVEIECGRRDDDLHVIPGGHLEIRWVSQRGFAPRVSYSFANCMYCSWYAVLGMVELGRRERGKVPVAVAAKKESKSINLFFAYHEMTNKHKDAIREHITQ